jgi:hypothetical protein
LEVREEFARQQRKIDSKAVFNEDAATVPCKKCRGRKSACTLCWGSGRIEYLEGMAAYAPYGMFLRLKKQLAGLRELMSRPPVLGRLDLPQELARGEKPPAPRPAVDPPEEEPPPTPGKRRPMASLEDLPVEIQVMVRNGDDRHDEGRIHLEKAMNTKEDATRVKESKSALRCFREAQTSYTAAQETCDERGLESPRALLDRARINLQALVIARKRSF